MKIVLCFALHLLFGLGTRIILSENYPLFGYLLKYSFSLLFAFFLLSKPNEQLNLPHPVNIKNILKTVSITLGFIVIALILNRLIPYQTVSNTSFKPNMEKFKLTVILAPVLEELLYRKLYLEYLLNKYKNISNYYFVIISAFLFGFTHYHLGVNSVFYNTIMGIAYGFIFMKYRNVKLCVVAHFLNNLLAFLVNTIR